MVPSIQVAAARRAGQSRPPHDRSPDQAKRNPGSPNPCGAAVPGFRWRSTRATS